MCVGATTCLLYYSRWNQWLKLGLRDTKQMLVISHVLPSLVHDVLWAYYYRIVLHKCLPCTLFVCCDVGRERREGGRERGREGVRERGREGGRERREGGRERGRE